MATYIQAPVEERELRALVKLAQTEERDFFTRNPHLIGPYRDRLIAVALCQGAALQYLRSGYGVKDFDVHFFYTKNPAKPRLSRAVKRIQATVGRFASVSVDFIRTVMPTRGRSRSIEGKIRSFLEAGKTANASHLSRKAVIGLSPDKVFGATLWRAETAIEGAAYHRRGVVKLVAVRYGQGETADPDANELLLQKHLGEVCQIVEVANNSIQILLKTGEIAWALPEEISRDLQAVVRYGTKDGPRPSPKPAAPNAGQTIKHRRKTKRDRLDLGLFRTSHVYRPGSGQTRKAGSWRDNSRHR